MESSNDRQVEVKSVEVELAQRQVIIHEYKIPVLAELAKIIQELYLLTRMVLFIGSGLFVMVTFILTLNSVNFWSICENRKINGVEHINTSTYCQNLFNLIGYFVDYKPIPVNKGK